MREDIIDSPTIEDKLKIVYEYIDNRYKGYTRSEIIELMSEILISYIGQEAFDLWLYELDEEDYEDSKLHDSTLTGSLDFNV